MTVFDDDLAQLARDMFATMAASQGVGLAATQVGRGISMFVFMCPDDDDVMHAGVVCNPIVTLPDGNDRNLEEAEDFINKREKGMSQGLRDHLGRNEKLKPGTQAWAFSSTQ